MWLESYYQVADRVADKIAQRANDSGCRQRCQDFSQNHRTRLKRMDLNARPEIEIAKVLFCKAKNMLMFFKSRSVAEARPCHNHVSEKQKHFFLHLETQDANGVSGNRRKFPSSIIVLFPETMFLFSVGSMKNGVIFIDWPSHGRFSVVLRTRVVRLAHDCLITI